jgi:hypothetical protein
MSLGYAAKSFSRNLLRISDRGTLIRSYCFGRRFFARGSDLPGRQGLTTNSSKWCQFFFSRVANLAEGGNVERG